LREVPPLDIPVDDESSDLTEENEESQAVFDLRPCSHHGTLDKFKQHKNDDKPLNLDERDVIACVWNPISFRKYFNDSPGAEGVQLHSSVMEKSETVDQIQLEDCLRLFNSEEVLAKEDAWYCSDCQEHVEAFKKFDIHKAPKILVVHLKRFSYRNKFFRERLNQTVNFPINDFDIAEFVSGPHDHTLKYDLYAISNHFGSLGGGHYTAFVRNRNSPDEWLCCDDGSVTPTSKSSLVSQAAYVLFYVRQDVSWPKFDEDLDPATESESEDSGEYLRESEEDESDKNEETTEEKEEASTGDEAGEDGREDSAVPETEGADVA